MTLPHNKTKIVDDHRPGTRRFRQSKRLGNLYTAIRQAFWRTARVNELMATANNCSLCSLSCRSVISVFLSVLIVYRICRLHPLPVPAPKDARTPSPRAYNARSRGPREKFLRAKLVLAAKHPDYPAIQPSSGSVFVKAARRSFKSDTY
jgi:hypothetical protein